MQLRLHFARFIYKMITSVPGESKPYICWRPREARNHNLSSWSKSSIRERLKAGYFHFFVVFHKEWPECKSAVLPVTSRTATFTESGELSMADVLTWYEKDALLRLEQVMNCGPGPSCWKGGYRYPLDKFLSSGNVIRWIVIFPVDSAIRVQKQPGPERSDYKGFCCTQRAIRKVFAKRATARLVALFWPLVCLIRMSHLLFYVFLFLQPLFKEVFYLLTCAVACFSCSAVGVPTLEWRLLDLKSNYL